MIAGSRMITSGFAGRFSIEATRPSANEIAQLAGILTPGTSVYLTAIPTAAPDETVTAAAELRKARLEPVIHVAARRLKSADSLRDLLRRLTGEAGVRNLLVIGGDVDAAGPYADALAVIQKGGLRENGIEQIGIGAYPEGHPRISAERLEAALDEKIATATAQGLRVNIVSQFSFSGEHIIAWLKQLRMSGIKNPVGIGLAGPTSIPALIRYAKRCGVSASLRGLMSGAAASLVGNIGPDRIIENLSASQRELGETHLHYFSFGGVVQTARYGADMARAYPPAEQKAAADS
jgi:methylenetetrahydrofolate reductase (NADPH)